MLRKTGPDGNLSEVACPECGRVGDFGGHGSYGRTVVYKNSAERVTVARVMCHGCRRTHAVLPEGVVPYKSFAAAFVLAVLSAWASGLSNREVRGAFGISETTRRRIVSDSRRSACALLACGASRAEVAAALASAGAGALPDMHLAAFGARFCENVRPRDRAGPPHNMAAPARPGGPVTFP